MFKTFILFLAVSLFSLAAAPAQAAPVYGPAQYYSGTGHWYQAVEVAEGISWTNAQADAQNHGGYLATITSEAENNFAFGLINDPKYWYFEGTHNLGPYLGGSYNFSDARWEWVTGASVGRESAAHPAFNGFGTI